jgi:4-aminobutyrate aminotransferase-like enzyme/Ser/Thr protein kinase RdoA (MazF antagonist)
MEIRGRVPVPEADAVRLARDLYGLEASARALPGEHDENFHLTAADGRQLVLKIMHPARERSLVELQCAALQHVARTAPDLVLPRVVQSLAGQDVSTVPSAHGDRLVWLLTFVPGTTLAEARPQTLDLLSDVGRLVGRLSAGLVGFSHPGAERELVWDLARAGWIRGHEGAIADPARRSLVVRALEEFEREVVPRLGSLRRSVIHGDANDWNVLVTAKRATGHEATSVIDFGDMHRGVTVAEPAVAAAYALLGQADPLAAVCAIVSGYHAVFPLLEDELALVWPLVKARLAVSVTLSAERKDQADDPYVTVSEAPAWEAFGRLDRVPSRFAHYVLRSACGLEPVPGGARRRDRLREAGRGAAKVLDADLERALVFDLGVGGRFLGADPAAAQTGPLTAAIFGALEHARASVGVGRYDEARCLYDAALFGTSANPTDERRTIHLGMDLFVPAGSAVRAPLDGVVHLRTNNAARQDYGPLVVLRHDVGEDPPFFTLYGHLSEDTLPALAVGQRVARGDTFARVGAPPSNGDWPPHVHFQIVLDFLGLDADYPGVARASERRVWKALSPDPNLVLGIPGACFPAAERGPEPLRAARRELLGPNLSLSYRRPLKIVRGWRQYLYDDTGRAYLDGYNNVPLVGHSHPRVVRAAQEQLAILNTNTRYLHENVVRYAERLTRLLPEPLRVAFFVNSGTEANELALRLARVFTRREDVIVLEHAYHGHSQGTVDLSPYKFDGPGGRGRKDFVHVAPLPDDYRGRYRRGDPEVGRKYAAHVGRIVDEIRAGGRGLAAFLAESLPSVGGQIVFPPGYLEQAYAHVRAAGGVCIADEVQVGFARLGTHFWGFETQGVVPDIVVLGKPIGNGFPLGAVVTTRAIADAFANGMEFFSTFGGNPVACAAGLAVLDVLEDEGLQERALRVGRHFLAGLRGLQEGHPLVGDVRGSGLFLGVELVRDRESREPATEEASYVVNRLRERGVLTGTDGPHENVLKLRPPLVVSESDADLFVTTLDEVLGEDPIRLDGPRRP